MQCLIRSKAKQQKSSLLADNDCRLYHLQGIDMSLSLECLQHDKLLLLASL